VFLVRGFDFKFACALIVEQNVLDHWTSDAGFDDAATRVHFPIHFGGPFAEDEDDQHRSITIMMDRETLGTFPRRDIRVELPLETGNRSCLILDDFHLSTWKERDEQAKLDEDLENRLSGYFREIGENAYATFNTMPDIASRPPTSPRFRRDRPTLERCAGAWLRDFRAAASKPGFSIAAHLESLSKSTAPGAPIRR